MRALTSAEQYRQFVASSAIYSAKYFFDQLLVGGDEKLGDFISDIRTGKTPPKSISKYYDCPDVSWFKPTDIGRDIYLNKANSHVSNIAILEKKATFFKKNTILITCIGDIGRIGILKEDSSSNQQITGILMNDQLLPEFTYLYLASHRENFTDSGVLKTTLEIINQKKLLSLPIKVPSIDIQKAVIKFYFYYIENGFPDKVPDELKFCKNQLIDFARLVDSSKVFSKNIKNELTYQQTLLKKLRQQILQDAIEGRLTKDWREQNPDVEPASELLKRIQSEKQQLIEDKKFKKGKKQIASEGYKHDVILPEVWTLPDLDDVTMYITDGTHQTPKYTLTGKMFLSAQNVKPFKFMPENHKYVSDDDFKGYTKNRKTEKGDLLVGRVGSKGETAVVDQDLEFAIYVSLGLVKTFKDLTSPEYLAIVMNSPYGNNYATGNMSSLGASAGNFNLGRIRSFPVPFPPLQEQKEIVKKVEKLFAICDQLEEQITSSQTNAEQLMQSVLKEAFSQNSAA